MILVDTSVWIDHFRRMNPKLFDALHSGEVLCHPFIVGELACGFLPDRAVILQLMGELPPSPTVEHDEVLAFVQQESLIGIGIGWVDAHLLASSLVAGCALWSLDKLLIRAARKLDVSVDR